MSCTPSVPSGEPPDTPGPEVALPQGTLRGTAGDGSRVFQGIPYAAPPVGDRRWAAPGPAPSWSGVRDASRPGPACPQLPSGVADLTSDDEDCLLLGVTSPDTPPPPGGRPVMVWLHGGGGTNGAGSLFDARRLAVSGDVVVVTVNYRLGILGALGLPGLPDSGTFGLLDQQAALRWVHANIGAFGGDRRAVTLFGESYGALAVSAHLVSPRAAGLFSRAVVQSGLALQTYPANTIMPGSPPLPSLWISRSELEELSTEVAGALGCRGPAATVLRCLRARPVADLLPLSQPFTRFAYGTPALPEDPVTALQAGRVNRMPVLTGGTRDEHRLYVAAFFDATGNPVTAPVYDRMLREAFGDRADAVAARYPLRDDTPPGAAWANVLTDRVWSSATDAQTRALARVVPTWAYEFADRAAPSVLEGAPGTDLGAYHSSEVFYQFDQAGGRAYGRLAPDQRALADRMNAHWAAFAHRGSPDLPDATGDPWPAFRPEAPYVRTLDTDPGAPPTDYRAEHQLDFWSTMPGVVARGAQG